MTLLPSLALGGCVFCALAALSPVCPTRQLARMQNAYSVLAGLCAFLAAVLS